MRALLDMLTLVSLLGPSPVVFTSTWTGTYVTMTFDKSGMFSVLSVYLKLYSLLLRKRT